MKQKSKRLSLPAIFVLVIVISTSGIAIGADTVQPGNTTNDSFNKSKQLLHSVIYKMEHPVRTFIAAANMIKRKMWISIPADTNRRRTTSGYTRLNGSMRFPQRHLARVLRNGEREIPIACTIEVNPSRAENVPRRSTPNIA